MYLVECILFLQKFRKKFELIWSCGFKSMIVLILEKGRKDFCQKKKLEPASRASPLSLPGPAQQAPAHETTQTQPTSSPPPRVPFYLPFFFLVSLSGGPHPSGRGRLLPRVISARRNGSLRSGDLGF